MLCACVAGVCTATVGDDISLFNLEHAIGGYLSCSLSSQPFSGAVVIPHDGKQDTDSGIGNFQVGACVQRCGYVRTVSLCTSRGARPHVPAHATIDEQQLPPQHTASLPARCGPTGYAHAHAPAHHALDVLPPGNARAQTCVFQMIAPEKYAHVKAVEAKVRVVPMRGTRCVAVRRCCSVATPHGIWARPSMCTRLTWMHPSVCR